MVPMMGVLMLAGCSTTKRLSEGEQLLRKNKVVVMGDAEVRSDALEETVRQEPNRRILGVVPLYLWAYNVPSPENFEQRNMRRAERLKRKNERRIERGKEPREFKPAGSWWRETVGEPPVIMDTSLTTRSAEQMQTYMIKHGWFNARVEAEIRDTRRRRQKDVVYTVTPGRPYLIDSIYFNIPDPQVERFTHLVREGRNAVVPGKRFNIDALDNEREAVTNYLRNIGYYDFNKELIYFDVDSALGRYSVNLTWGLVPRQIPYEGDPDSLITVPYKRYKVGEITIADRPSRRDIVPEKNDTAEVGGYTVVDRGQLRVRPRTLTRNVLFREGDYYSADRVTLTYRRMSALPIVRNTAIRFTPAEESEENTVLNCAVTTVPAPRQNMSMEGRGTNRGGFLGVQGALSYQNRNIFGGAERLEINLTGGVEAQQLLTGSSFQTEDALLQVGRNVNFNTLEFGPEVALTIPKFLIPVREDRFAKRANPRTTFRANLSYQQRPDYQRTRSFGALSYRWNETEEKSWTVSPMEVSLIKIFKSEAFENQLQEIGDVFLINSFQDHFITAGRVAYTYNTRLPSNRKRNAWYYRGELESAGSLLRGAFGVAGAPADEDGNFSVLGINFAHYLKTTHDFRYYRRHNEKMSTAYRITAGLGLPLENLNVLPFEKSFFGGGANDIRAWEARTLGPGSYRDPERNFDKIGDILLEANVEYRFALVSFLEGAFFADAGNIWTVNPDEARPGAHFETDRFLSEIAVGGGFGLRFNFDFFIVRVDAGLQIRDPALDRGERWLFQPKDKYDAYIDGLNAERTDRRQLEYYKARWNLNLGIGYPF